MTLVIWFFLSTIQMTLLGHFLPIRTSVYVLCVAVNDSNDPTWSFSRCRPFSEVSSESALTIFWKVVFQQELCLPRLKLYIILKPMGMEEPTALEREQCRYW